MSGPGQGTKDLTQGPIASTLMLFAMPTLASNILQSLNGSINAIWVGRFLGPQALAATANANIIMFLMFSIVFGFGMASTVMIGQAVGRRDMDAARRAFGSAVGFCMALALVVAIVGWLGAPALLRLLATPVEAYDLALVYLRVIFIAMPATLLSVMIMMGLRGVGDARTPLIFMIVSVAVDLILNPVLILGLGPFPAM
ncbi:MAG: MATE family efflux transporter, partial [Sphingobium sp.]|nr:MATE family efflux transporter [Sphingobium sp.]